MNNLQLIADNLTIFQSMYDFIRVVDPLSKKVAIYEDKHIKGYDSVCFEKWNNDSYCKNCISMRAINESRTITKMEFDGHNIYMVMASPLELQGKKYAIEIIKDMSDVEIIKHRESKSRDEIAEEVRRMNDLIIKDELTMLYNRRYIKEKLPVDLVCSRVTKKPLSIIMIDIDYFKRINDDYGHVVGDYLIKEFSKYVNKEVEEENSWVARYGGEELLVVLPERNGTQAFSIGERIRKAIEKIDFKYNDIGFKITISLGVYEISIIDNDLDQIISKVDERLYKAKNTGRNKTFYKKVLEEK